MVSLKCSYVLQQSHSSLYVTITHQRQHEYHHSHGDYETGAYNKQPEPEPTLEHMKCVRSVKVARFNFHVQHPSTRQQGNQSAKLVSEHNRTWTKRAGVSLPLSILSPFRILQSVGDGTLSGSSLCYPPNTLPATNDVILAITSGVE
uniref:Uncharacterized protein n=1 Tax=Glossina pallidipes TaxID=7398 RepID=A0A1B0ADG2_GLOPL